MILEPLENIIKVEKTIGKEKFTSEIILGGNNNM